ncbi:hypothetical protein ERO13_D10G126350v2 [Gossypium hirsutum]|nr:hypothetical protein ERO13_D10G126350v2 [Gossypium hirsutum]KAG4125896.1 hypothetical protein ERO13_D10G126350v2 [Gossypium hirsutum]KAG4125897.1 hypothetical protein ERO13_D10G126350v2 [Gossypium hirsutum]
MGMRGGWRGAEACEVEWLRTWGNGASGQVGGFAGVGPGRFWALQYVLVVILTMSRRPIIDVATMDHCWDTVYCIVGTIAYFQMAF